MSDLSAQQVADALSAMPITIRGTRASLYRQHSLRAARYEHKGFARQAEAERASALAALEYTPASAMGNITKRCNGCGKITTAAVPLARQIKAILCPGCKAEADAFAEAIQCRSTMD